MVVTYKSGGMSIELGISLPFVLLETKGLRGLTADAKIYKSAMQAGATVQSSLIEERVVTIKGAMVYEGDREKEEFKSRIYKTFNPAYPGELVITNDIGVQYTLEEVYVTEAPVFNESLNGPEIEEFTFSLLCPKPFLLSDEKKVSLQGETGTFEFDWEILREGVTLSEIDANAIKNAFNGGSVDTPVRVVIRSRGYMENPYILNITTGQAVRIKKSLNVGESIVITTDYGNKRVTHIDSDGRETNIFKLIDLQSSFFQLIPGDNLIKYGADSVQTNLMVDVYYKERHLGV